MNTLEKIMALFFPSNKDSFNIKTIPRAPKIYQLRNSFSLFDYHSKRGKELVYYIKRFHDPELMQALAEMAYQEILHELSEQQQFGYFIYPLVLAVPTSKKRLKERGFNQVSYFSKTLAKLVEGEYKKEGIIKTRETLKQALIGKRQERIQNVKDSFDIEKNTRDLLAFRDVILTDDLITSGATMCEISRILYIHRVRNIIIISIAH
jgi:ComF family protein